MPCASSARPLQARRWPLMSPVKTILTVDDSRTIRDLLASTLSQSGYKVVQAADGVEGLEVLANTKVDAIITDINMPVLGGFGFIEKVRSDPEFRAIPILVLTTENSAAMKEAARKAGATGWLVKPFDTAKLTDTLRRVGV
ncbi:MAG TPA: response regulator [Rhizomicrobium sp.]|nr:response regulator [Rhizomicrobium sp.]